MKRIAVFFHIAMIDGHEAIYREIKNVLDRCLLLYADVYTENYCAADIFEFPTLDLISGFSRRNPGYDVLYLHTKGASHPGNSCVADWRRSMTHFMVEKHEECRRKLKEYDLVGCNYRVYGGIPHWQGNFWWARSDYLSLLHNPRSLMYNKDICKDWKERHKCEAWVMSGNNPSWYQMYDHQCEPYKENNPQPWE